MRIGNVFLGCVVSTILAACAVDNPTSDSDSTARINSASELEVYLRTSSNSPLDRLSGSSKQHFLSSLVFGDTGLGGFSYDALQSLPESQIVDILKLFGAERTAPLIRSHDATENRKEISQLIEAGDYPGYACTSAHTCTSAVNAICMSGC